MTRSLGGRARNSMPPTMACACGLKRCETCKARTRQQRHRGHGQMVVQATPALERRHVNRGRGEWAEWDAAFPELPDPPMVDLFHDAFD